jgi:hypothetical protein
MSLSPWVAGMLYLVNRKGQGKDDTVNEDISDHARHIPGSPISSGLGDCGYQAIVGGRNSANRLS